MNLKGFFYKLVLASVISHFILSLFKAVTLPDVIHYFIACLIIFALSLILSKQFLRFFTLSGNFWTHLLAGTVLVGIAIYFCDSMLPGFFIETIKINSMNIGSIHIQETMINKPFNIILVGFTISFFYSVLNLLKN